MVFRYRNARNAIAVWHSRRDAIENEDREILTCRDQQPVGELGHFDVDVPVIESISHFLRENRVQQSKVNDKSCLWIDVAFNSHVAHITMPVKMRTRACAERRLVLLGAPFGPAISVRSRKRDAPRE